MREDKETHSKTRRSKEILLQESADAFNWCLPAFSEVTEENTHLSFKTPNFKGFVLASLGGYYTLCRRNRTLAKHLDVPRKVQDPYRTFKAGNHHQYIE